MTPAEKLLLMRLETDALRRLVELEALRKFRLEARIAGRTDQVVCWVESDDEVDDRETLDGLRAFAPTAWWGDESNG